MDARVTRNQPTLGRTKRVKSDPENDIVDLAADSKRVKSDSETYVIDLADATDDQITVFQEKN